MKKEKKIKKNKKIRVENIKSGEEILIFLKEDVLNNIKKIGNVTGMFLNQSDRIYHYYGGMTITLRILNVLTEEEYKEFSNWLDEILTTDVYDYNFWKTKATKREGWKQWRSF